jgi:hypothetical protein
MEWKNGRLQKVKHLCFDCVCGDAFLVDQCYLVFFEMGCLGRMPNSFLFGIFFSTCFFVLCIKVKKVDVNRKAFMNKLGRN